MAALHPILTGRTLAHIAHGATKPALTHADGSPWLSFALVVLVLVVLAGLVGVVLYGAPRNWRRAWAADRQAVAPVDS